MLPLKVLIVQLVDIRRIALIACIAAVLGVLIPVWNAMQTMIPIGTTLPLWKLWLVPLLMLMCISVAIMPAFYFALYRNEGTLRLPKRLRSLSLAAAITFGTIIAVDLTRWIGTLGPYWTTLKMLDWRAGAVTVVIAVRNPRTISLVSSLLGEFSNIAFILLLTAFFRQAGDESCQDVPTSKLLTLVTKVAVIAWGLVVAGLIVGLVLTPYDYFQLLRNTLPFGRTPPPLWPLMLQAVRRLLEQACLFTAPYVVYRSWRGSAESPESAIQPS
jgi:hypothetical protein